MKTSKSILFLFSFLLLPSVTVFSQKLKKNKEEKIIIEEKNDRNVMLNASSTTEPRQVAIGIPITYTPVMINGLPAVYYYWPNTTSNHWRSDASLSRVGLLKIAEVALSFGDIGYGVNSFTEMGGNDFKGKVNYGLNAFGSQKFDMNISGAVNKNLHYTVGIYQNFDPGSFKLGFTNYTDRTQMYRLGLTQKIGEKGKLSMMYKYANLRPLSTAASYAPFIYDGNGKISELNGFKMGRDSYLPTDGTMEYMDVNTGVKKTATFYDLVLNKSNEIAAYFDYQLDGINLAIKAKYADSDNNALDQVPVGIITNQEVSYAFQDGKYSGDLQKRQSQYNHSIVRDAFFTAEISKQSDKHLWKLGINEWYSFTDFARSTTEYYHTVEANPKKVIYDGSLYSNFNGSTEYDKGFENKLALYFSDNWVVNEKLRLFYGGRMEYYRLNVDRLPLNRFSGFHIGAVNSDNEIVRTQNYSKNGLNMAFSGNVTYNIQKNWGLMGDATYIQQYRHLEAYSGALMPLNERRPFILGQAGVFFNHPNISLVSAFTYAKRSNDYGRLLVVEDGNTSVANTSSGVETIGWTTDAEIKPFKNFSLHLLFTLQDPKYNKYEFSAFNKEYDYGKKYVTGLSKILIEIDPSYNVTKDLRFWASFRYFGKQYANIANSIYFKGRWETFAGVNYNVNKYVAINGTVVNFLNQKGAKGVIPGSDLISDGSIYNGSVMAGTYLRPLTFEISASIKF